MFGALGKAIMAALTLFLLSSPGSVYAEAFFFQDEFNEERSINTLDSDKWTVFPNAAVGVTTILETGGNLITTQANLTHKYPLVVSKVEPFPAGDFSAEVKFQYTEVSNWGTGIAFSDKDPNNLAGELLRIDVWQDNFLPHMRIEYKGQMVKTIANNINPHTLKVDRIGLKYFIYLDNLLVYTSPETEVLPKVIWIGNPANVQPDPVPVWTKFNVDYIRVKEIKTPLILIPGIGGSEFKVVEDTFWSKEDGHGSIFTRAYSKDEKVWVNEGEAANPGPDDYFDILRLQSDGVTPEANLALTGELYVRSYQTLINFFVNDGYILNEDLFIFPYDWRLDITDSTNTLNNKINQIKLLTGSQKIDILSHSMGGLVARNYIADPIRAQNVRKLFILGTPHLGSGDFTKKLIYGGCLWFEVGPFCLTLAPSEVKDVIGNMISGYELTTSQNYFDFYDGSSNLYPYPIRDDRDIDNNGVTGTLNYNQIKELLTNLGHNTSLFTLSEIFHSLDSSLSNTNEVEVYIISGSGIPTLGQIIEKYAFNLGNIKITKKDEIMINGDETVPLLSASLEDIDRNIFMNGDAKNYYTKQKHGALVGEGPALNLIKNLLEGIEEFPEGVSDKPYKLNGTQLSVHSPVNIHVYDENGNHTGSIPDGDFETNISGSTYDILDDAKFIWLPDDGVYNIVFEATREGSFDFKIRNFENDLNTQTILYEDIPLEETSAGQTIFDTSGEPPILEVDGTNYTYFSILEGDANYDHKSPKISFNTNTNILWPPNEKLVDVNITGSIDEENPYITKVLVDDEYDLVEPTIETYYQTSYNQNIQLQASRRGDDLDGRTYLITVITNDLAGNEAQQQIEVIVPHDQR